MDETRVVARVERPSPGLFRREYVRPRLPVVITGVADRWPALSAWNLGYFRRTLPDTEVRVEVWERDDGRNDPADYLRRVRRAPMRIGEFLDLLDAPGPAGRAYYLAQYPILKTAPRLRGDIRPPDEYMQVPAILPRPCAARMRLDPALWIGPRGAVTTLHFDSTHNLFVQISGAKKVILIPPGQSGFLYYPCRDFGLNLHFSPVEVERPDLARHPRFARATALELTVEPGEMLYIPATWWHYLRALEPSISLNFWWNTPTTLYGPLRHLLLEWRERIRRLARGRAAA